MMPNDRHFSSTDQALSEEQQAVLPRIQKLLALAAKNSNAEEAASAAAKAQDLLLACNLSADMLDQGLEAGTRGKEQMKGGSRQYERDLWDWVAELNFCLHWVGQRIEKKKFRPLQPGDRYYGRPLDEVPEHVKFREQYVWQHFMIGRKANVMAAQAMALYLQGRVDQLAMEFVYGDNKERYGQRAMSFREGAVAVIVSKLVERRQDQLAAERRKEQEAREAADRAGAAGVSMNTGLTISSLTNSERDENIDFMNGDPPGTFAAKRAARAAAARAADEEYTRWAAAHPEEAKAQEAERAAEAEKASRRRRSGGSTRSKSYDPQAYYAGRAAGDNIGLDPQAGQAKPRAYL